MTTNSIPWGSQSRPRIFVLGAGDRVGEERWAEVKPILERNAQIVLEDFEGTADLSSHDADFVVVLGGDGSILRSGVRMGARQLPVLGVNLGKLGFLANTSPGALATIFPMVCNGDCAVVEHLMFMCEIWRDGVCVASRLGLNETVVVNGPPFSIVNIDLYVDSEWATTYSCDGLIISTPVGSTAHNLSAGGPILRKSLQAFVISPLSPHTLTVRPVVDSADRVLELAMAEPHAGTTVVVDGQVFHTPLTAGDRVRVRRAEVTFQMIECQGHGYYSTLREKLGWAGRFTRGTA